MRSLCALLIAACGCSSQLDESSLLGKGDSPGAKDMAGPASPGTPTPDLATGSTLMPTCTDFSDTPVGLLPAGWADVRGSWRVALEGGVRVLRQESEPTGGNDEFVVSTGVLTWRDLQVSALVTSQGHRSDECIVVRYRSTSSYYALCLDSGPDDLYPSQWELVRRTGGGGGGGGGGTVTLANGALTTADQSTHQLGIRVVGRTLTPIVDNVARSPVTDDGNIDGAIGLLSESKGRFTQVCVTHL